MGQDPVATRTGAGRDGYVRRDPRAVGHDTIGIGIGIGDSGTPTRRRDGGLAAYLRVRACEARRTGDTRYGARDTAETRSRPDRCLPRRPETVAGLEAYFGSLVVGDRRPKHPR